MTKRRRRNPRQSRRKPRKRTSQKTERVRLMRSRKLQRRSLSPRRRSLRLSSTTPHPSIRLFIHPSAIVLPVSRRLLYLTWTPPPTHRHPQRNIFINNFVYNCYRFLAQTQS